MAAAPCAAGGDSRQRPTGIALDDPRGEQLAVLALLARGADTPAVSKTLGITVREARQHLAAALSHYKASNATHAVASAIAAGDLPHNTAAQE